MTTIKELTVFRACPMKDTEVERQTLAEVIYLANEIAHGARLPVRLRLVTWEQAPPGMHPDRAQGRINETLQPTECDVLVGIFRSWFGVAEADGRTPTEGEILDALDAWRRNSKPDIKVYFGPTSIPSSDEEALQIDRVSAFKERLSGEGLYGEYRDNDQFRSFLIRDLLLVLNLSAAASSRDNPEERIEAFVDCDPTMLRADGAAERAGDVKITLAGPRIATGGAECVFDVDLYTSPVVNVTSALLTGDLMEAMLVQEIAPGYFGRPIYGRRRTAIALSSGMW